MTYPHLDQQIASDPMLPARMVGNDSRAWREAVGVSAARVARALGVHRHRVARYEAGVPPLWWWAALAGLEARFRREQGRGRRKIRQRDGARARRRLGAKRRRAAPFF